LVKVASGYQVDPKAMDAEDVKRRIEAARMLRGIEQQQLDRLGHAEGLGKQELSRTERGELPLTRVRRDVLLRLLRLPDRWLVSDDIDEVVGFDQAAPAPRLTPDLARDLLAQLVDAAGQAHPPGEAEPQRAPSGRDRPAGAAADDAS
jgi:hypothetical protein